MDLPPNLEFSLLRNALPVINDSEALQYVGKAVEVRGLVFAVSISPLGTIFTHFGRGHPNQTFVGFIASAQESLTLVARKTITLFIAAVSLILTASHSHAGLGWTLAQFEQQYGKPVINQEQIGGRIGYAFRGKDYIIAAFFLNTQVSRIMYICRSGSVFSWGTARALLSANAPWGLAICDDVLGSVSRGSLLVFGQERVTLVSSIQ